MSGESGGNGAEIGADGEPVSAGGDLADVPSMRSRARSVGRGAPVHDYSPAPRVVRHLLARYCYIAYHMSIIERYCLPPSDALSYRNR